LMKIKGAYTFRKNTFRRAVASQEANKPIKKQTNQWRYNRDH